MGLFKNVFLAYPILPPQDVSRGSLGACAPRDVKKGRLEATKIRLRVTAGGLAQKHF